MMKRNLTTMEYMSTREKDIFVDREEEMDELKDILRAVKKGKAHSVFIEGEAGIGKTTLVSEFKHHIIKENFDFLMGTSKIESSEPYHPFKEAFKKHMDKTETDLEGRPMAFLGKSTDKPNDAEDMFNSKKEANFHESTKRIKKIASQNPFVVFLDDIHWADKATVDIFSYMVNKIESEPILFIVAYRPTEISTDHPLENLLHRSIRRDTCEKIELSPLEKEHTGEMIRDMVKGEEVPQRFIDLIHEKTEGNPLFVKETIKQMQEEGLLDLENDVSPSSGDDITVPDIIRPVIERRVNRLEPDTKRILHIGSVIGNSVPFSLLVELSDSDEFGILDHIDILLDSKLWYEESGDEIFHFSHGLVRDAVLEDMKKLKRKILHERVADQLEKKKSIEQGKKYSTLAYHYSEAEEYSKAIEYYMKAGEKAQQQYAYEDSIDFYEKGLELIENSSGDIEAEKKKISEKLADLFRLTERYERSKKLNEELYEEPLDEAQEERMNRKLASLFFETNDLDRALEYIEKGLNRIEENINERCRLLELKGWILMEKGEKSKALDVFREEIDLAKMNRKDEVLGEAINELGSVVLPFSEAENLVEYLIYTLESEDKKIEGKDIPESLVELREDMNEEDILERALDFYERCANLKKNRDGHEDFEMPFDNLGVIYKTSDDILDQALHYYGKSLSLCRELEDKNGISVIYYHMGLINQKKGQIERAIKCYENSLKCIAAPRQAYHIPLVLERLGEMCREKGDIEDAVKYHENALDVVEYGDRRFSIEYELVLDSIESGDLRAALKNASDIWLKAQSDANTEILIKSRWVAAKAYLNKDEFSEAKNKLEDALDSCVDGENDGSKAKILYHLGLLKKRNDEKGWEDDLKEAYNIFSERRMMIWEDKCKDELKKTS